MDAPSSLELPLGLRAAFNWMYRCALFEHVSTVPIYSSSGMHMLFAYKNDMFLKKLVAGLTYNSMSSKRCVNLANMFQNKVRMLNKFLQ